MLSVASRPAALLLCLGLAAPAAAGAGSRLVETNAHMTIVCPKFAPLILTERQPGCSGWAERSGRRFFNSYNSLGLRDKDYPPRAPAGVLRLLVVGGSLMTGSGLQEADTPPRRLETELRRLGRNVEVIDAAGEGYEGWQNAVRLDEYLDAYSPRVVLYHLAAHYVFVDRAIAPTFIRRDGLLIGRRGPFAYVPRRWRRFFQRHPALPRLAWFYAEQWRRVYASWRLALDGGPRPKFEDLLAPTLEEVRQMAETCAAHGAAFYVVYDSDDVSSDQFLPFNTPIWIARFAQRVWIRPFRFDGAAVLARLRAEGERGGFGVLSLAGDLARLKDPANLLPSDYHWNEAGSQAFAQALAKAFLQAWDASSGEGLSARRSSPKSSALGGSPR